MWECPLLCFGSPLVTLSDGIRLDLHVTSEHKVFFIFVGPKLVRKNADAMQNNLHNSGDRSAW